MAASRTKELPQWLGYQGRSKKVGLVRLQRVLFIAMLWFGTGYLLITLRYGTSGVLGIPEGGRSEPLSEENIGAQRRIGKASMVFDNRKAAFFERALKTHEAHCQMHGYPLHVLRHRLADGFWNKPAYVLSLLLSEMAKPETQRLEWLFWTDADTIVLNPFVPLETFLPPPSPDFDHVQLIVTSDFGGINAGVFFVRVGHWAVDLFEAIVRFRDLRPDYDLPFYDQTAMVSLLEEPKFRNHVVRATDQTWFNAFSVMHSQSSIEARAQPGDFLVHFAGIRNRARAMSPWLDRAEKHLSEWEVPLWRTRYPTAMNKFWAAQRRLKAKTMRQDTL